MGDEEVNSQEWVIGCNVRVLTKHTKEVSSSRRSGSKEVGGMYGHSSNGSDSVTLAYHSVVSTRCGEVQCSGCAGLLPALAQLQS